MFDVILDRDGTLNLDAGFTYSRHDYVLAPAVQQGLVLLKMIGARFSIATGQSGIALGKYTVEDMHKFNEWLVGALSEDNIEIEAIVYCPHHPSVSDCDCRKPQLGMLRQIEGKIGAINWKRAWGIGDKPTDAEMILNAGGRSVLLRSGPYNNKTGKIYWNENDPALKPLLSNPRNFVADSFLGAAIVIQREVQF